MSNEEFDGFGRPVKKKIVICEDDVATLELLCEHLSSDGFDVLAAPTAADAMRLCQYSDPDMLLLDLRLPGSSGLDVLKEIKEPDRAKSRFNPHMAVIVLSGRGTEKDRVRALEAGADDYVLKPFSYGELLARINAVLRRCDRSTQEQVIRVGGIVINQDERSVTVGERPVKLSTKEFDLLVNLARNPHQVASKETLLREVWGYKSIAHTRTLEAHASRLRRKLDPARSRYVVNFHGVGYALLGPNEAR